jgi:signal transduction histidine kinase
MDFINILLIIVAVFNAFLGSAILIHGPKKKSDISYAILVAILVLWAVTIIIIRMTDSWIVAFITLAISHIVGLGIAISFWYFVSSFSGLSINKSESWVVWLLALLFSLMAFLSDKFIVDISSISSINKQLTMGPLHYGYSAFFGAVMLHSFYKLSIAYGATEDKGQKSKYLIVFLGTAFTFVMGSIFNVFLLDFGNSEYIGWGPIATVVMVMFITYAIMKLDLMSIRMIGAELFTASLMILVIVRFIFSTNVNEWMINGITLILGIFFGILSIRSVVREAHDKEQISGLAKELKESNMKLVELDRLKSEFLSFASHQVKTPMSVVKGYATLIYDGTYGPVSEKIKETAQLIINSANGMISLVNSLLDLRKIEEGKIEFKFEVVNLTALVQGVVDELQQTASSKGLFLEFHHEDKPLMVKADSQKIFQVFQNLIDNSIKYTDKGWIKVDLRRKDGRALFSVKDSGRGISPDLLPNLFEEFRRDTSSIKKIEGTGLGLYIAKYIVSAHNGTTWAESEGNDKGSAFFVQIPLSD